VQSVATDVARSVSSVCLSVCWAHGWAVQNDWTDRDAVCDADSCEPKEPCVRWGRVKIGRLHSPPRGLTRWRCGFFPGYFGHLMSVGLVYTFVLRVWDASRFAAFTQSLMMSVSNHQNSTDSSANDPSSSVFVAADLSLACRSVVYALLTAAEGFSNEPQESTDSATKSDTKSEELHATSGASNILKRSWEMPLHRKKRISPLQWRVCCILGSIFCPCPRQKKCWIFALVGLGEWNWGQSPWGGLGAVPLDNGSPSEAPEA